MRSFAPPWLLGLMSHDLIRPMAVEDLPAARRLLSQLGYPLEEEQLARRFAAVSEAREHAVFVADGKSHLVALCHIYARPALDKPPEAVVQALVVDAASRGCGVGRAMMAAAEAWASGHGFGSVALASNVVRSEAHAFYEGIGYERTATSHLFRKGLG
jgi:GNAT superfamily N-acetyltransferase